MEFKKGIDRNARHASRTKLSLNTRKQRKQDRLEKKRKQADLVISETIHVIDQNVLSLEQIRMILEKKEVIGDQTKEAIFDLRQYLSQEESPHFDYVVDIGIIPLLVLCLYSADKEIVYSTAWCLSNIAAGETSHVMALIEHGVVEQFVDMLVSESVKLRAQVSWGLGNIAGDNVDFRDMIIVKRPEVIGRLGECLEINDTELTKDVIWCLSNLFRLPSPDFRFAEHLLPSFLTLLRTPNHDILMDTCWTLTYITDGPGSRRHKVITKLGLVHGLTRCLSHESPKVQLPALRSIGNIATGDVEQVNTLIDNNVVPKLRVLLTSNQKSIRREASWTLSNIAASNDEQKQVLIDSDIFPIIKKLIEKDSSDIKREAIWVIVNSMNGATDSQLNYFVNQGIVAQLSENLMSISDPNLTLMMLAALETIFKFAQEQNMTSLLRDFEASGGLDLIEELQEHENADIYGKAYSIVQTYFDGEEPFVFPEVDPNMLNFNFDAPIKF